MSADDVIAWAEGHLTTQRAENARGYARAEALVELRGLLIDWANARGETFLTIEQMWASPTTEEERAHLAALIDLITPEPAEDHDAATPI